MHLLHISLSTKHPFLHNPPRKGSGFRVLLNPTGNMIHFNMSLPIVAIGPSQL